MKNQILKLRKFRSFQHGCAAFLARRIRFSTTTAKNSVWWGRIIYLLPGVRAFLKGKVWPTLFVFIDALLG